MGASGGTQSCFPLVDALLNLSCSADRSIESAALDCLLLLCGIREPLCTRSIARHTLYPQFVATKIADCVAALPSNIDPIMIEDFTVTTEKSRNKTYNELATAAVTSADVSSSDSEDNESTDEYKEDFNGRREMLRLFFWLSYADKVNRIFRPE